MDRFQTCRYRSKELQTDHHTVCSITNRLISDTFRLSSAIISWFSCFFCYLSHYDLVLLPTYLKIPVRPTFYIFAPSEKTLFPVGLLNPTVASYSTRGHFLYKWFTYLPVLTYLLIGSYKPTRMRTVTALVKLGDERWMCFCCEGYKIEKFCGFLNCWA